DSPVAFHSMSIGGQNNNSLIIFGGMSNGNALPDSLYIFDTTSKSLASKAVTTECTNRVLHTSVTKYDSKVFILGGSSPVVSNDDVSDVLNTLCVYDSLTNIFKMSPISVLPNGISHHTSTLLSDNLIYVIGGISNVVADTGPPPLSDMNIITIYDTNLDTWTSK
ncbi:15834_t:CDS:1, partial [Entrophospora sp. SA101]